jgi:carboxypeptidase C (cathepsin A)
MGSTALHSSYTFPKLRKLFLDDGQGILALTILGPMLCLAPARAQSKDDPAQAKPASTKPEGFKPEQQATKGSVTIAGTATPYDAFAGTIVVHPKGWDDVPQNADKDNKNPDPEASMFYVAYLKSGDQHGQRPVTFFL